MLLKKKLKQVNIHKILFLMLFIGFYFGYEVYANPTQIIKNVICKEKNIFKDFLENNQNEKLTWFGLSVDGSSITELYVSPSTHNWTILETDTNGISCATIGGKGSQKLINN